MTEVVVLALLGGVLTVDAVTVGQFMLSRPLVAGGLAGLVLGDLPTGLLIGALLEVYLLVVVPSGGGRYPESGPAVVVGVAASAWTTGDAGIAFGVATALLLGYVFSLTQGVQRHLNERWVPDLSTGRVEVGLVTRGHLLAILVDFARGVVVSAVALVAVQAAVPRLGGAWPLDATESRALLSLGAFVSLGVVARALLQGHRWGWLVGGCAVGISIARWLP